ncbi:MAG: site-specific DNA-methyltransferase [Paracoccaceae bacterium]|nr:site-specific DNA-methyltransferase [Paracoccaceae bacterium]
MNVPAKTRSEDAFLTSVAGFDNFGTPTRIFEEDGLTYFVNEFWTAKQRQGGRIHEISYRACFKAELPAFFIDRLTRPGDTVHDPFMGRGTTPIQAAMMGRRALGTDVNPLSVMLARPRLRPVGMSSIVARLDEIAATGSVGAPDPLDDDLRAFFHPRTLAEIKGLQACLGLGEPLDSVDDWIRMIALNRLTGHSPGFFSVYTMPPNQAVSAKAQHRINARREQTPPERDIFALIARKSKRLLARHLPDAADAKLWTAPAEATPHISDASVDLVVTSPPFLDIVDYAQDNWLRCWFAGIDPGRVPIAIHRSVSDWTSFTARVFAELARVVRPGGHVAFEVGEVRKGEIMLERAVRDAIAGLPFEILGVLINAQDFTKTSNCWGVANNAAGVNTNRIVLARRC